MKIVYQTQKNRFFLSMKSVNKHRKVPRLLQFSLAFLFIFSFNLSAQDAANGEKLFKSICAACHKLDKKLVGPPLQGITEKRDQKWLIKWIKDSPGLIKSGDKLAIQVFEENNKLPMTPNPQLSNQDIIDILEYTKGGASEAKTASTTPQEVDPGVERGKKVFKANCAACHKLQGKLIGPELFKIGDKRDAAWLKKWIKDNNALAASGDKLAKEVQESNPAAMIPFPQLSDQDLDDLLKYFAVGDVKPTAVAAAPVAVNNNKIFENPKMGVLPILGLTLLAFVLLALIVAATTKKSVGDSEEKSVLKSLLFNPFLRFLFLIFVLLGGAWLVFGWLMQIDVNEGYTPIQPIAFSHAVHAGDNKIDCQYCHSSAKHSKTSGVPTANVCMNCHKSISEYNGELFGGYTKEQLDGEIQKIYDAVGWDKENMKYIEGYKQKPIEWVRIHKLADFAYYNHSQHVTVAGLDCQKCHGPVEEMHDMYQFSPLTMGWCINCHRGTNVAMEGNEYYQKIHEQLAKKRGVDKVTAAEMGGIECGKCHY